MMKQLSKFSVSTQLNRVMIVCGFLFCLNLCHGQNQSNGFTSSTFYELNGGLAAIGDFEAIFPGMSFLFGATFINENNLILEVEAGLALPTMFTGKMGVGRKFNRHSMVVGIRPFPFNIYLQNSFRPSDKGYWIMSVELNPLNDQFESSDSNISISFGSKAIFNVGYRWHINRKE